MGLRTRGDGVKARLEPAEKVDEVLPALEVGGEVEDQVDDLAPLDDSAELVIVLDRRDQPGMTAKGCPFPQERFADRADVIFLEERLAERAFAPVGHGHGDGGIEGQHRENLIDESDVVLRHRADGVSDLVGQARSLDDEFNVASVARGGGLVELLPQLQNRGERFLFPVWFIGVGYGDLRHGIGHYCRREKVLPDFVEDGGDDAEPFLGGVFVIDVAIDPRGEADRAEFLKAGVEAFPHLAEVRVVRVPEGEHGKSRFFQAREIGGREFSPELDRVVRRIAFAPGARDEQDERLLGQVDRGVLFHVDDLGAPAVLIHDLGEAFAERLRIAALAAEEEKGARFPGCRGSAAAAGRGEGGDEFAEVGAEPLALLCGERRVVRDIRDGDGHAWF